MPPGTVQRSSWTSWMPPSTVQIAETMQYCRNRHGRRGRLQVPYRGLLECCGRLLVPYKGLDVFGNSKYSTVAFLDVMGGSKYCTGDFMDVVFSKYHTRAFTHVMYDFKYRTETPWTSHRDLHECCGRGLLQITYRCLNKHHVSPNAASTPPGTPGSQEVCLG